MLLILQERSFVNLLFFSRNNDAELGNYEDNMFLYAMEVLSLGLIWHGFYDSIKDAHGDRILCY